MMYRFNMIYRFLITVIFCLFRLFASSQEATDTALISKIPNQYFESVSKKANTLQQNLDKKSQKVLTRMQKEEAKLQKKLAKIDSIAANNIFSNTAEKYNQLKEKLKNTGKLSQYIPKLDSLTTSLKFLDEHPEWMSNIKDAKEKLDDANDKLKEFQSKLKEAEDIKQFLKERKQFLKEQLEKFGLVKELKKINKEVYYYSQQINEYKEIFKDSKKAERKALELLSKTKLFKDFMKKNSMLASLFRMPGDPNDPVFQASLAGLQTRAQVNSLIQNQISAGGPNARQQFSQNLQAAQSQLQQLKDKINKWGGGSSEDIMPEGFKPNDQKTKSFFQRLEFGTNIQTQKSTNFFPTISDVGLSLGYKLNDRSTVGLGTSFKVGWGTGWNDIHISQQGLAFRSFIDWKLKGTLWISGGYEQNLKTVINSIDQLRDLSAWQQSGLLGISKVVSVKSKLFKKTKVQLLWDFLSYQQIPRAQPIVFRIGYSFN
jgi:Skp family chaperone for outer membrane proteins